MNSIDMALFLSIIMSLVIVIIVIEAISNRTKQPKSKPETDPTLVRLYEDVMRAGSLNKVAVEDDEERAALAMAFYNLNSAQEVRLVKIQEEIEEKRADLFDILSRVPIDIDRINDIEESLKILYTEEERLGRKIRANYWLLTSKIRRSLKENSPNK